MKIEQKTIDSLAGILERFLKARIAIKIALGLIAAGVSILGFNDFFPYIVVLVRPELADLISSNNDVYTIIGICFVILGSLLPLFLIFFDYFLKKYKDDLTSSYKLNQYSSKRVFDEIFNEISLCLRIFDYQIDFIDDFIEKIRNGEFNFNDIEINNKISAFCSALQQFQSRMSLRLSPNNTANAYDLGPNKNPKIVSQIQSECASLIESYSELNMLINLRISKSCLRFFA